MTKEQAPGPGNKVRERGLAPGGSGFESRPVWRMASAMKLVLRGFGAKDRFSFDPGTNDPWSFAPKLDVEALRLVEREKENEIFVIVRSRLTGIPG